MKYKIDGVKGAVADNVKVYLEAQSFDETTPMRRVLTASEQETEKALRALGYYQSQIEISQQEDQYLVSIKLGAPLLINEESYLLELRGEALQDPQFQQLLRDTPLQKGAQFNHGDYEQLKANLNRLANRYGYFDAKFEQSEVQVSLERNQADLSLIFDSGERYHFGELVFSNDNLPNELFVDLAKFKRHDLYDAEEIGKFNQQLGETDFFQVISVRPDLANRKDGYVDILVDLALRPKDTFEVGGGVSTDVGPRVRFKWTRPWVNDKGHSTGLEAEASLSKQSLVAYYRIPMSDPVDDYLGFSTGAIREETNDTRSEKIVGTVTRQWRLDEDWKTAIFLRAERENYIQGFQRSSSNLILPGTNVSRLRTEGGLDPYWGDNLQATLELASPVWGSDVELARVSTLGKWLRTKNDHRFLWRADLGAIYADSIFEVPASMRFFAGGDQSIRGYDYKTIAPKDEDGALIGGLYLTVASIEYNYQFADSWRFAVFTDAGTATNDFSEPISVGAGFGIRWLTLIGPLRVDFAKGFQNESDPWRIHFSMGPDL